MPMPKPPKYPKELTSDFWDKKKGLVARVKNDVPTGIGEAAKKAEKAFKAVKWEQLDFVALKPLGVTREAESFLEDFKARLDTRYKRVAGEAAKAVLELHRTAASATTTLTKAKLNDAAKGAKVMAEAASEFLQLIRPEGLWQAELENTVHEDLQNVREGIESKERLVGTPKPYLPKLTAGMAEICQFPAPKKSQDLAAWREAFSTQWGQKVKNQGRSVGNTLKGKPELARFLQIWSEEFVGFSLENIPALREDDPEIFLEKLQRFAKRVYQVVDELEQAL